MRAFCFFVPTGFKKREEAKIPNYSAHTFTNLAISLPLIYYGYFHQRLFPSDFVNAACLSFAVATLLFSPDLDLGHSIPTKNWGILSGIWWGYPKFFRHRGASHSFLLSSLTKIFYLLLVTLLFGVLSVLSVQLFFHHFRVETALDRSFFIFNELKGEITPWILENKKYGLPILFGLILSDWVHILTDKLVSFYRRLILRRQ